MSEISIVQQNIRSLRANFDVYLANLNQIKIKPTVIILTEIWIEESESTCYCIDGYSTVGSFNQNYRSGGTIVYLSTDIRYETRKVDFLSGDCIHCQCNYDDYLSFSFLAVYRLHLYSQSIYISELSDYLNERINNPKPFFILGDININLLANENFVGDYRMMFSFGFESLINEPTRLFNDTGTCIDHVFVQYPKKNSNNRISNIEAAVMDLGITDHLMVGVVIYYEPVASEQHRPATEVLNKNRIDYRKFPEP